MATFGPPPDYAIASPLVYVDVYPLLSAPTGVTLTVNNAGLMNLKVQKYIRGSTNSGRFEFTLAPGGLNGVSDPITWTSILTQYSLCVIYAKRGQSQAILMVGVLDSIEESQMWNNESVRRTIQVRGFDLTLYFTTFAYYVLNFLGLINTLPGLFGPASSTITGNGLFDNSPDKVGAKWFTETFLGSVVGSTSIGTPTQGVLNNTVVPYQGSLIPLKNILTYWFEAYTSAAGTAFIIPVLTDFLISEGTFYDKFIQIFPFPFYEFFVNTVPSGYYPQEVKPATSISTKIPGFGSADIVTVARVNPLPTVDVDSSGKFVLKRDRWDALDLYKLNPLSFISSEVGYRVEDIKNFYVISPIGPLTAPGGAPGNNLAPAIEQMGYMYDADSINKYGYRPEVENVIWWVDPLDIVASNVFTSASVTVSGTAPSQLQYESFLLKVASYYEAMPNMLYGTVRIPLWPSIIVGNKFEYYPFKNNIPYTFYITGVEHSYDFGRDASTILYLERGLPSSVYNDVPANILLNVHLGKAERVAGNIVATSGVGVVYKNILNTDPFNAFPFMGAYNASAPPGTPGWPPSTPDSYDSFFRTAAASTPCGPLIDWRILKSIGVVESGPGLNNAAKNINPNGDGINYYGIMQVASNAGYDNNRLQTDPSYNIQAGSNILCQKLTASGGNMYNALAFYGGSNSLGYNDPKAQGYVNKVLQQAYNNGVTIIANG